MDRLWAVFGTALHKLIEAGNEHSPDYIKEERLFAEVNGWTVSGGIDLQHITGKLVRVIDWKSCSSWAVEHEKPNWISQLNTYAYLVEKTKGLLVDSLQIGALIKDYSPHSGPPTPIMMIDIPLWTPHEQAKYILERVRIHQEAERLDLWGDPLPECTAEERWDRPDKWAVKKEKAKRASRVFDDPASAEDYFTKAGPGYILEPRPGDRVRCAGYCECAKFCEQNQQWLRDRGNPAGAPEIFDGEGEAGHPGGHSILPMRSPPQRGAGRIRPHSPAGAGRDTGGG